jgi:hypothetical protein
MNDALPATPQRAQARPSQKNNLGTDAALVEWRLGAKKDEANN